MTDYIKKTSQAGGSKRKEDYIAHKRFDVKEDKKEEKKPESKYLKKKFKSNYITEKKKEIKTEVKKGFITKKKEPVIDLRVEFAHGSRPTGAGAATHGLGRAFLKGGKV